MALQSDLFCGDAKLEAAANSDPCHITVGARGDHVCKIQEALNRLDNANVSVDGAYGTETGDAVLVFKERRGIINPQYQKKPDNIVGRKTVTRMDDELKKQDEQGQDPYVCRIHRGYSHNHSNCPLAKDVKGDAASAPNKQITHIATPVNPQGFKRKICIGGIVEVKHLGFEDFVPDPTKDKSMPIYRTYGRPYTTSLGDSSVSDICFRSVPIDEWMQSVELPRICAVNCRLTYAANAYSTFRSLLPYLSTLGPIVHHTIIPSSGSDESYWANSWHVCVVQMLLHKRK
jgi:hypothetical protein